MCIRDSANSSTGFIVGCSALSCGLSQKYTVPCLLYTSPDECRAMEERNAIPGGAGQRFFITKNLDTIDHIVQGEVK